MSDELAFAPAVTLARLVSERRVSPVELVELFLQRIERFDGALNSIVTLDAEGALRAARAALASAGGDQAPPFAGVPIAVKDLHLTEGLRTTFGTRSLAGFVPDFDEEHVARIRRAGFIVVGKTNVPELGTLPFTESELLGPCRSPWDLARTPGGSSGGAAAALAAGLVPVAHGSDGAGSIRIPASNCGLVGLKPARGRVSNAPLFGDLAGGLTTAGALARHVVDAAGLLDAMRGYAAGDPHWAPEPARPYVDEISTDPGRLRVGLVTTSPLATFGADAVAAAEAAARLLEDLGHCVEPFELPVGERLRHDFETVWAAGLAALPVDEATLEPFNAALARRGRQQSAAGFLQALTSLQAQSRVIVGASLAYDVVACPTLTRPPLRVAELAGLGGDAQAMLDALAGYVGFAPVANITGQPAVSLPLHASGEGLPVGVMFTGRPADEATLFRLAAQLERATGWAARRPPVS